MAEEAKRRFRISSVIENLSDSGLCEGDPERTEMELEGALSAGKNSLKISYFENTESGRVDSEITVEPTAVTVIRRGAVVSEMRFSEGLCHRSLYEVVPYRFDTEVYTKRIRNALTADGGRLDILYTMKIGGQNKNVRMKIECL